MSKKEFPPSGTCPLCKRDDIAIVDGRWDEHYGLGLYVEVSESYVCPESRQPVRLVKANG